MAAPSASVVSSAKSPAAISNYPLVGGGIFSLAFAAFQVSGIWWPPKAIRYMGGPALLKIEHPLMYAFLCLGLGMAAGLFGLYALSGAGKIRRLPLLRSGLVAVTVIYLLRGLLIIPQIAIVWRNPSLVRLLIYSAIALCVGGVHLVGLVRLLRQGAS